MPLENIVGNDAYALVEPGTMFHSDQLQAERLTNKSLRDLSFCTADGLLYDMHERGPRLSITRRNHNLVLYHIDDALTQLAKSTHYRPNGDEALNAITAEDTVSIDLTQLRLQGSNAERGYLVVPTSKYDGLNSEERKLAERVHGSGGAFVQVMKMLADARIRETRIYALDPKYVEENIKEGPIGRESWLVNFDYGADFSAYGRIFSCDIRLRGVRRVASVT